MLIYKLGPLDNLLPQCFVTYYCAAMTTNTHGFTRMQLSTSAYYGVQETQVVV